MVATKKRKNKKLEKFFLPKEDSTLDQYIQTHKTEMQNHVINCIEYALREKLDSVEVFRFQDSPYTVNIQQDDFADNIKFIFESFLDNEKYEDCPRLKKLLEQLNYDK